MEPRKTPSNTHYYDNNMGKEVFEKINQFRNTKDEINKDEKLSCFNNMRVELENIKTKDIAMKFYNQIIESYIQEDGKNYDPINELDPIDLLYIIYIISKNNNTVISLLADQLEDMKTGFCPQGRTIRLVQIINSFL